MPPSADRDVRGMGLMIGVELVTRPRVAHAGEAETVDISGRPRDGLLFGKGGIDGTFQHQAADVHHQGGRRLRSRRLRPALRAWEKQ